MLHVLLVVKFRAFGITFANIHHEWVENISEFRRQPKELIRFSERGVTLVVGIS